MLALTPEGIVDYLKSKEIPVILQEETNQPYFIHKTQNGEYPVFFRIFEKGTYLQILTFFPDSITREKFNTLSRLLNQLNNDIDMPGFGMDEKMKVVFHRLMIPTVNGELSQEILDNYLRAIIQLCKHFGKVIKTAIHSNLSFDEMLKLKTSKEKA